MDEGEYDNGSAPSGGENQYYNNEDEGYYYGGEGSPSRYGIRVIQSFPIIFYLQIMSFLCSNLVQYEITNGHVFINKSDCYKNLLA